MVVGHGRREMREEQRGVVQGCKCGPFHLVSSVGGDRCLGELAGSEIWDTGAAALEGGLRRRLFGERCCPCCGGGGVSPWLCGQQGARRRGS